MTSEIEKRFFKAFGIEPEEYLYCYWQCKKPELENVPCNNKECEHYRHDIIYPYISDAMYIELMYIFVKGGRRNIKIMDLGIGNKIRETLLQCFIDCSNDKKLVVDVQRFFEEQA